MISSNNDGKEAEKDMVTPPRKKLKQARLSFQKLSPSLDTSPKNVKKRKISEDSGDEIKVVKVVKPNSELCKEKNDSLTLEKNLESEASNSKKVETKCLSECEIDVCVDSKDSRNELEQNEGNLKLETSDKDIEKECIDRRTEDEGERNTNAEVTVFESENEKPETTPSKDVSLNTNTDEKPILNNEIEIDNQSESSDAESEESSEGDNELNDTVEDHNSSGSCADTTKGDDNCQNTSRNDLENESKAPLTPKNNLRTDIIKKKKLTPKQLLQREEAAKKKEEKAKQRKEKERRKAEEKEKKRKEKEEKEELKRKEKEEKEEQRRKEKEEKEKKKLAELEQKSEEKRLKEEERRKKEEQRVLEKRKKDEKKLAEEEAKRKEKEVKKKEAAAFANFFVASKGASKINEEVKVNDAEHFMPFQVKADMRLAPLCRSNFDETRKESFDRKFKEQSTKDLYFDNLRKSSYVRGKCVKTWPLSDLQDVIILDDEDDDDVILGSSSNEVVESHPTITHPKAKLLMFCENRRPPYWGTWTKKSKSIRPTCPFRKDEGFFDYEVDSDDEWEEEEPGESLHGSDDEKESEDEYEVDNDFFVPHGYLSDEENCEEEEVMNPETMKAKLKFLEMEFEEEMKHKTERIKPRLFGCFWASQKSDEVGARVLALLSSYRAVSQDNPIVLSGPSTPEVSSPVHESQGTCPSTGSKKKKFPESFVPALIKLVHGNINGRGFLVKEFSSYMRRELETARQEAEKDSDNQFVGNTIVSKLKISEKIKEIASWMACPDEGPFLNRLCWYVPLEIRVAYGLEDLVIPNKVWNYINAPKRELELSNTIPSPVVSEANSRPKSLPLITKFTKKLSPEERQRQLALSNSSSETEIEILDDVKVVSASEGNGKSTAGDKSNKENSSVFDSKIIAVNGTPGKTDVETPNSGLKKLDIPGSREKLLQFKSKGASIIPHLEQRKRVPILKSVPLGQAFSPSTSNSSKGVQEKQTTGKNDVKETSENDDCIVID